MEKVYNPGRLKKCANIAVYLTKAAENKDSTVEPVES